MEAFFSGTIILFYLIAYYASEVIFVVSCFLPAIYGGAVLFSFRFGGCGRIILAKKRLKKMVKKGALTGEKRGLLYKRCIKRTPASFRAAYALFLEGRISDAELAMSGMQSVRFRKSLIRGGSIGIGVTTSLFVFLTFYFAVPIAETFLRTAICAFHAAVASVVLHFSLYGYALSGEKAAQGFAEMLDRSLLRVKRETPREGTDLPRAPRKAEVQESSLREDEEVASLRAMLRELESDLGRWEDSPSSITAEDV